MIRLSRPPVNRWAPGLSRNRPARWSGPRRVQPRRGLAAQQEADELEELELRLRLFEDPELLCECRPLFLRERWRLELLRCVALGHPVASAVLVRRRGGLDAVVADGAHVARVALCALCSSFATMLGLHQGYWRA